MLFSLSIGHKFLSVTHTLQNSKGYMTLYSKKKFLSYLCLPATQFPSLEASTVSNFLTYMQSSLFTNFVFVNLPSC